MAFIERRGPQRWRARVRGIDGKERSRTFPRRRDAEKWATSMDASKTTGEWLDPRLGKTRFEDFANEWFATTVHLKSSTRASYQMVLRRYVLPAFGTVRLTDVTRTRVQGWMAELIASGTGPGTVRNAYRTLSRILTEAERARLIGRNPAAGIPLPKSSRREMRFLGPSEITRLADAIEPRYRALVLTAAFTGARWGELAALRPDRLDLLRGTVDIREALSEVDGHVETVTPKTGERRTVGLPRFLCEALSEHLARYPGRYLFSAPEGGPLRRHNFYNRVWERALRNAGLDEGTRFHDLRHSAASMAIAMGANVKTVQQMLGHSSASVTLDVYSHAFPALSEQLRDGFDATYRDALAASSRPERGPDVVTLEDTPTENTA